MVYYLLYPSLFPCCSFSGFRMHGFSNLYFKTFFLSHSFIKVIIETLFFSSPTAWLVDFYAFDKIFQPQASQRSKASPKAWVIFLCFCTVSFTASRAWISGGIVPMNPCNKILNELYLGTINLPSLHILMTSCAIMASLKWER